MRNARDEAMNAPRRWMQDTKSMPLNACHRMHDLREAVHEALPMLHDGLRVEVVPEVVERHRLFRNENECVISL